LFQFDPVLDNHFELLEKETVAQSVPARIVLDEIVFVGVVFLDCSVERYSDPE